MPEVGLAGWSAELERFGEPDTSDEEGHVYVLAGIHHLLQELYAPKTKAEIRVHIERT